MTHINNNTFKLKLLIKQIESYIINQTIKTIMKLEKFQISLILMFLTRNHLKVHKKLTYYRRCWLVNKAKSN